jgi:3-oxoacyl-[acyl-carrier protein] reductase
VADQLTAQHGSSCRVLTQRVDLRSANAIHAAATEALRSAGGCIDVVLSNAGIVVAKDVDALTAEDVRATLAVNVEASFSLLRHLLPPMKARGAGAFAFVSSVMGFVGSAMLTDYCASK